MTVSGGFDRDQSQEQRMFYKVFRAMANYNISSIHFTVIQMNFLDIKSFSVLDHGTKSCFPRYTIQLMMDHMFHRWHLVG